MSKVLDITKAVNDSAIQDLATGIDFTALFAERTRLEQELVNVEKGYQRQVSANNKAFARITSDIEKLKKEWSKIEQEMNSDPDVSPTAGHTGTKSAEYGNRMTKVDNEIAKKVKKRGLQEGKEEAAFQKVNQAWDILDKHKQKIKKAFEKIK